MATMIQLTCEQCGVRYEKIAHECRENRRFCSTKCQYASFSRLQIGSIKCCTKCKRDLPLDKFWKSPQKASGYYPSCIECERAQRDERLITEPMCCRCGFSKHMPRSMYCQDCDRIVCNKGPRKWVKRTTGLEYCKICEQRPRQAPQAYCAFCKNELSKTERSKKAIKRYRESKRQRETARSYATGLLQRGKIKRGLCVYCGDKGTDFHHWDYLPKTRNFEDICQLCHVQLHVLLDILLALIKGRALRIPNSQVDNLP